MRRGERHCRPEAHRGDYEALVAMGEERSAAAFKALMRAESRCADAKFERARRRREREAARAEARRARMDSRPRAFRVYERQSGAVLEAPGKE